MIKFIKKIVLERNVLSLAGNLSYAAMGFISFMILTRSMDKVDFGAYTLFIAAASFFDRFRLGLTNTAIVRFLSGADREERRQLLGSNALIGLTIVFFLGIIIYSINLIANDAISKSPYYIFFQWYPLMAFSNLFWNNAVSNLQSFHAFGRIFVLRLSNITLFVIFLIFNYYFWNLSVSLIILVLVGTNLFSSLIAIIFNWDGVRHIRKATKEGRKKILNFGKFSVGTVVGSSILKSSDVIIIGLSPFIGAVGVAKYAIPLKLTQLIEIPLKSFMATAYPKLSRASIKKDITNWKSIFYQYAGATWLLYIPFIALMFIFSDQLVLILGGDEYRDSLKVLSLIFKMFLIYGLILPLDRISGVALDSINKPKMNLIKVLLMATVNIIGDLIAVFIFKDIVLVSFITVLNSLTGVLIGYYYLNKEIKINFPEIFVYGIKFYKTNISKITKKFI